VTDKTPSTKQRLAEWFSGRSWFRAGIISTVILAMVALSLPPVIKSSLNQFAPWAMQQADLENAEFHISHLSWYKLEVDKLKLEMPTQGLSVQLNELTWSYNPFRLFSGKLGVIEVEKLALEMAEQQSSQTQIRIERNTVSKEEIQQAPIIIPSPADIFAMIPLDRLEIRQLDFKHPQAQVAGQLYLTNELLQIQNQLNLAALQKTLDFQFSFKQNGALSSQLTPEDSDIPVFLLQSEWKDVGDSGYEINLQQTTDIQSLLGLLAKADEQPLLQAKTAIQAWQLALSLPRQLDMNKPLPEQLKGNGLLQIQIDDFEVQNQTSSDATNKLLEQADLAINIQTQLHNQWSLLFDTLSLTGKLNLPEQPQFQLATQLSQPLEIDCLMENQQPYCKWHGALQQTLAADQLTSELIFLTQGAFENQQAFSNQNIRINLDQKNPLWPQLSTNISGDLILSAQQSDDQKDWNWQLALPLGFNGITEYQQLPQGQLAPVDWTLLPDWQVSGTNGEVLNAKPLAVKVNKLDWRDGAKASQLKKVALQSASFACDFDWLKLQYSKQLRTQAEIADLPIDCNWNIESQPGQWEKWPVPALAFTGKLNISQPLLRTEMQLTGLNGKLDLSINGQHDFTPGTLQKGAAQIYLNNLKLDWDQIGLANMVNLTKAQLLEGAMSAQGWIHWQQFQPDIFDDANIQWRWQPDVMVRVDDMAGSYNNTTTWDKLDFQMAVRRPFYETYKIDTQISAQQVNAGIAIDNILARSTTTIEPDFSKALIEVQEVHSEVLGGQIKVPLIRFDTSQEVNAFGIEVIGLEMTELAKLEKNAGVNATGQLDGVLPIVLLPEGPQIPAGTLYARAPGGVIQYRGQAADTLKQSDPTMGLAMQLLNDFRYDQLQTDITYQPDGELKLALKFQGHNPEFFDGQATHLNLNLDYNLLDLLESLRISQDLVEKLENKYQ
jgi:hypothetical protein